MLGLVLYDPLGAPVFGTNGRFDSQTNLPESMTGGTIEVRIHTACLRPDTYYISLWLGDHHQDHVHLDKVLRIEVGVGVAAWQPPRSEIGSVFLPTKWSYCQE